MTRRVQTILIGLVALAAAFAAAAATIPSPVHPYAASPALARLAAPGQEGLDFDAAALAALRADDRPSSRIENFPTLRAPPAGSSSSASRSPRRTPASRSRGKTESLRFRCPRSAHFSGVVEGEPGLAACTSASTRNSLVAYVHSTAGHSYVGPDESSTNYIVRARRLVVERGRIGFAVVLRRRGAAGAADGHGRAELSRPESARGLRLQTGLGAHRDGQPALPALRQQRRSDLASLRPHALRRHQRDLRTRPRDPPDGERGARLDRRPIPTPGPTRSRSSTSSATGGMPTGPSASYPRTFVHYLSGHPSRRHRLAGRALLGDFPHGRRLGRRLRPDAGLRNLSARSSGTSIAAGARDGPQRRLAAHALLASDPRGSTSATAAKRAATPAATDLRAPAAARS